MSHPRPARTAPTIAACIRIQPCPCPRQRPRPSPSEAGFSLVEVMVAAGILATGLLAVGQLLAITAAQTLESNRGTRAAILAGQAVESIRSRIEAGDPPGMSPASSLHTDTAGFVEYLDGDGHALTGGPPAPSGTVYVRRVSVQPLPAAPDEAFVVSALVTAHRDPLPPNAIPGQRSGEALLTTIIWRRRP